ncbi:MAG: hypothetical protein A2144_00290 [Chloroflexi bacterium RBG_16_50_9]|nr:MAG: hypothetical protein A2144_00290 [Chloroflexi bacterium RBG_16_50_9]
MKILTVIPWFPSYSPAQWMEGCFQYRQAKKLVDNGHEVVVLTIQKPGRPSSENVDGILVYRFPAYTMPKIRYFIPFFPKLNRLIVDICKRHKIDLIEFFSSDFLTSVPAIYIKKKTGLPVVVVVNGFPGMSWFSGSTIVDTFGYIYTNLIGKRIIKSADGIRLLHSSLRGDLLKLGINGKKAKVRVIHQGVDVNIFHPRSDKSLTRESLGVSEQDFFVLYAGRLVNPVKMKGTDYLIEAVKDLLPQYHNLKLILAGDGDGRKKNEAMASSIKDNVIFTGQRNDIFMLMSAADVVVLTSLSEGCPIVVLEASACGIPVIASRVGGVPDIVEDGKTGIVISPRNITELKQALIKMMNNPLLRVEMGKRARERIEQGFTWDKTCSRLEEFYLELIKQTN